MLGKFNLLLVETQREIFYMSNFFGNTIDWIGTALNLPEMGISEAIAGNKATHNTGNRGGSGTTTAAYQVAMRDKQAQDQASLPSYSGPIDTTNSYGDQTTPQSTNYYTGGSSAASAASAAALQQQRFYQALLDSLAGRKQSDQTRTNEKYDQSINKLGSQRNMALDNLNREDQKLGDQRKKSLAEIQADTQNILQGANTTLGMYGAGNSSATDMSAFGAADLANKSTADVTDQYNEQVGDIALNRRNTEKEYEDEKNEFDQWIKDQNHDLNTKYTNLENDYRGKIGGESNLNAVVDSFRNLSAPEVKLSNLPDYKAEGLTTADLTGETATPTLTQDQAQKYFTQSTVANKKKKEDSSDGYL